jgi:hypothetical protein
VGRQDRHDKRSHVQTRLRYLLRDFHRTRARMMGMSHRQDQVGWCFLSWELMAQSMRGMRSIVLFGDAVVVMKDAVAESVIPVGWPPMKDLMATTIGNGVPIYV